MRIPIHDRNDATLPNTKTFQQLAKAIEAPDEFNIAIRTKPIAYDLLLRCVLQGTVKQSFDEQRKFRIQQLSSLRIGAYRVTAWRSVSLLFALIGVLTNAFDRHR